MKPEKQLYQWDTNQSLVELTPSAQYVDYPIGDEVIRLETDGTRCRIPDELLQTYGGKTCYERYPDGTFRAYSFTVLYAPKPPEYVYTPEERTTFEALTARVDAAIEEIKRRADSGEFTPKKGVDYFTEEDKTELMEGVSSGAVGEFRKVVDSATTEYNDNHNLKLAKYNANASEKLTTYDTNAEQHTSDYNRNAAEKLEAYNQNATTKTAEFDANAAALQTEVDRLRGECDNLAAENRKQENRISALMKLNKGQTYDILPEEGESASRTAPSGSKYVSVDKVGGKSIVWNQQVDTTKAKLVTAGGVTVSRNENGKLFLDGTATGGPAWCIIGEASLVVGHKYISARMGENIPLRIENKGGFPTMQYKGDLEVKTLTEEAKSRVYAPILEGITVSAEIDPRLIDLTLCFGAGNEPTAEQFERMFPAESYPYNPGEIISSRTETITAGTEAITTGFPELRSALAAHDYIDMDGGTIQRNVGAVDLGTLTWDNNGTFEDGNVQFIARVPGRAYTTNGLCDKFEKSEDNALGTYTLRTTGDQIAFTAPKGTEIHAFIESMSGATLYYELATPTTEQVAVPEALTEWIPVEAGGTVTFQNADESKQLPVPNAVSWVRKLDEVN